MGQRRLFSPDIVGSDAFIDMPISSQALYFHLGMYADDDGFVNPKRVMRMVGTSEDDLKVLISKRFVLEFDNGVIVIKHWLIHNTIRKDRYHETQYIEQKKLLFIKENGSYTEDGNQMATIGLHSGNQMAPEVKLSKEKLSKSNTSIQHVDDLGIREVLDFWENTLQTKLSNNKSISYFPIKALIEHHGKEKVMGAILAIAQNISNRYFPAVNNPRDLENKWLQIMKSTSSNKIVEV